MVEPYGQWMVAKKARRKASSRLNPREGNKPRNQGQSIKAEVSNLVANEENMEEGKPTKEIEVMDEGNNEDHGTVMVVQAKQRPNLETYLGVERTQENKELHVDDITE